MTQLLDATLPPEPPTGHLRVISAFQIVGISACLLLTLELARSLGANWDEYNYLSKVHLFQSGLLSHPLQSFHVHWFGWAGKAAELEIDQILSARLAVWSSFVGTCLVLYAIGRRFLSATGALFSVLTLTSFSYVLEHASSFRADTLATFLILLSAWLLGLRNIASAALAGALLSASFLLTVKSVFLLPAWLGLVLLHGLRYPSIAVGLPLKRLAAAATGGMIGGGALFLYHWLRIAEPSGDRIASTLGGSWTKTILETDWWPRWDYLYHAVLENPVFWVAFLAGLSFAIAQAMFATSRRERLLGAGLLLLSMPLMTLSFYRNAFPYFYAFLLPPIALLCGYGLEAVLDTASRDRRSAYEARRLSLVLVLATLILTWVLHRAGTIFWFTPMLILPLFIWRIHRNRLPGWLHHVVGQLIVVVAAGLMLISAHATWSGLDRGSQHTQRTILQAVHRAFPEPVNYIDRCSMVASFPRSGFLMSTWGMENYHQRDQSVIRDFIEAGDPRFVLANHPALASPGTWITPVQLLPADAEALAENFVAYWGPIRVAGKQVSIPAGAAMTIPLSLPGRYRLHAESAIRINGRMIQPNKSLQLESGEIVLESPMADVVVTLALDVPSPPDEPPPDSPIFRGFGRP